MSYPPPPPSGPYPHLPPKKSMSTGLIVAIVVGCIVLGCCGIGVVGAVVGLGEEPSADGSASVSTSATSATPSTDSSSPSSPSSSAEPSPAATSEPAEPEPIKPTQLENMESAIKDADVDGGKVEQLGGGRWLVTFDVKDNLSNDFIRSGAASDIFDMARQIEQEKRNDFAKVRSVDFQGMFSLVDKYGNEEDGLVIEAELSGATISKINYDNLIGDFEDLERLASGYVYVLPDLQD